MIVDPRKLVGDKIFLMETFPGTTRSRSVYEENSHKEVVEEAFHSSGSL